MKLSEAIKYGRALRPESHQGDPFVRVVNEDDLRSDVWGAAVEAVHSLISKRSWTAATRESDMAHFVELQQHHFGAYFKMAAFCPGAQPRGYVDEGIKIVNRHAEYVRKGEEGKHIGPVTNDCQHVVHLAGFVEHVFYVHNWTSEEVAQAIQWYEQQQAIVVAQTFEHYQAESLRRNIGQRVVAEMRQREMKRHRQSIGNRTYVH